MWSPNSFLLGQLLKTLDFILSPNPVSHFFFFLRGGEAQSIARLIWVHDKRVTLRNKIIERISKTRYNEGAHRDRSTFNKYKLFGERSEGK